MQWRINLCCSEGRVLILQVSVLRLVFITCKHALTKQTLALPMGRKVRCMW